MGRRATLVVVVSAALSAGVSTSVMSQGVGGGQATRGALEEALRRLELSAESPAYSARLRDRARDDARAIRDRLGRGDFEVGDRVYLSVEREEALTDTFTVREGPELELPEIGAIPLDGVLRSELRNHVRASISRFLRDPVVRVQSLIRLSIVGSVGSPGFHSMPIETVLSDALMSAGGPTAEALIDEVRIERQGRELWDAEHLRREIVAGRTLDQLNLRAGDQIIVPSGGRGLSGIESPIRALSLLLAIPAAIFGLTSLF